MAGVSLNGVSHNRVEDGALSLSDRIKRRARGQEASDPLYIPV